MSWYYHDFSDVIFFSVFSKIKKVFRNPNSLTMISFYDLNPLLIPSNFIQILGVQWYGFATIQYVSRCMVHNMIHTLMHIIYANIEHTEMSQQQLKDHSIYYTEMICILAIFSISRQISWWMYLITICGISLHPCHIPEHMPSWGHDMINEYLLQHSFANKATYSIFPSNT